MRFLLTALIFISVGAQKVVSQDQPPSIDDLVKIVRGDDSVESAEAIAAIVKRKPVSEFAIETLIAALKDNRRATYIPSDVLINFPVETVGSTAADALTEIGQPAVSPICKFLESHDEVTARRLAIRSLAQMEGHAAEAIPSLKRLLGKAELEVRFEAVAALVTIQRDPSLLAAALGPVLGDESPDVRAAAIRALSDLGDAGSRYVPQLIALLDDTTSRSHFYTPDMAGQRAVRYDSAMALAGMGAEARGAIHKLREMIKQDEDSLVRVAAAFAVVKLDNSTRDALNFLIAAAGNRENGYDAAEEAIQSLGKLGPLAHAALPTLDNALKHHEAIIRIRATEAICLISPETAESRLIHLLSDEDALVRESAIEYLGSLEKTSPQLLKAFIGALEDSDAIFGLNVRHAAVVALGNQKGNAIIALPRLNQLIRETEDDWLKNAAIEAVRKIKQGKARNVQEN